MKVTKTDETVKMDAIIDLPEGEHLAVDSAAVRAALGSLRGEQCFFVEVRTKSGGIVTVPLARSMAMGLAESIQKIERRAVAEGFLPEEH